MDDSKTDKRNATSINKDIRSALEKSLAGWDQLMKECDGPSANDQRLTEMKSLLQELKAKLDELSL